MGVGALVEGSVRTGGGQVRVNVELIDAQDGLQLWSGRFECDDSTVATDKVASRIASGIAARLSDSDGVTQGGPKSAGLCERGFGHLRASTLEDLEKVLTCFESAKRLDPGFAAPLRGLALVRAALVEAGYVTDSEALQRAGGEA